MVPPATPPTEQRRRSSSSAQQSPMKFKFPDVTHEQMHSGYAEQEGEIISRGPSPRPLPNGLPAGLHSSERWPARKTSRNQWSAWANGTAGGGTRHGRQKSLSEAIKTVRTRKMSMSENAHEIADSLKAPVSPRLVVCPYPNGTRTAYSSADFCVRSSAYCGSVLPSSPTRRPRPS
jgi:solute carrier family 35, member E1